MICRSGGGVKGKKNINFFIFLQAQKTSNEKFHISCLFCDEQEKKNIKIYLYVMYYFFLYALV